MARPRKEIDFQDLDKLMAIQCTAEECAQFFEVSVDTIERRIREEFDMNFAEYFSIKRGHGKIALRRKQYQVALSGNTTLLIWLGKQYLGQSDKTSFINDRPEKYSEPETLSANDKEESKTD